MAEDEGRISEPIDLNKINGRVTTAEFHKEQIRQNKRLSELRAELTQQNRDILERVAEIQIELAQRVNKVENDLVDHLGDYTLMNENVNVLIDLSTRNTDVMLEIKQIVLNGSGSEPKQ